MKKKEISSTDRLLRVIAALLVRQQPPEFITLREQIKILDEMGLEPIEIAEILGRTNIYVNKELSELRKIQKGKQKGKQNEKK